MLPSRPDNDTKILTVDAGTAIFIVTDDRDPHRPHRRPNKGTPCDQGFELMIATRKDFRFEAPEAVNYAPDNNVPMVGTVSIRASIVGDVWN